MSGDKPESPGAKKINGEKKMKKLKSLAIMSLILMLSITLAACSSSNGSKDNNTVAADDSEDVVVEENAENDNTETNVYAGGYVFNEASGNYIAGYWENGAYIPLTDESVSISLKGIAVDESDVYAVGDYTGNDSRQIGGYWENAVWHTFDSIQDDTGTSSAAQYGVYTSSIIMDDGDMFVAGEGYSSEEYLNPNTGTYQTRYPIKGTLWADETTYILENSVSRIRNAYTESMQKITLSDDVSSMIFVAGYCYDDSSAPSACFWSTPVGSSVTDLVPNVLTDDDSKGYGIAVKDTSEDLHIYYQAYICGCKQSAGLYHAGYWVYDSNGWTYTWTALHEDTNGSCAYAIVLEGSDVYIGGYENNGTYDVAGYWKNGTWTALSDGASDARVDTIVLDDGTLYAGGYITDSSGNMVAGYWKGSEWTALGDGTTDSEALSLVVTH
jgi:hypothetical protein